MSITPPLFGYEFPYIELWERSAEESPPDEEGKLGGEQAFPDHFSTPRRLGGPTWRIMAYYQCDQYQRPRLHMSWNKEYDVPIQTTEAGSHKTYFRGFRFVLRINWLEIDDSSFSDFVRRMHNWMSDETTERQIVVYPHYRSNKSMRYVVYEPTGWDYDYWLQKYRGFEGETVLISKELFDEIPKPLPMEPETESATATDYTYGYTRMGTPIDNVGVDNVGDDWKTLAIYGEYTKFREEIIYLMGITNANKFNAGVMQWA